MEQQRKSLYSSIILTVGLYGLIEIGVFYIILRTFHFPYFIFRIYLAVQILFHIGIVVFLVVCSSFFYIIDSKELLIKVNFANKVTLLRISMLPSLLFLIIVSRDFQISSILIPAIGFTFITDLVDGWISRATHQETYIGKILDAVSDYSVLLVIAIVYIVFQLIPLWLFCIILLRLLFQAIGMLILLIIHKTVEPQSTLFGKIAVATIMLLFVLELFRLYPGSFFIQYLPFVEYAAGIIIGLSIFDKFYFFLKTNKTSSSC